MSAVIEVRACRAKPGMCAEFLALLQTRALPIQRKHGIRILGPFASHDDDVGFVGQPGTPEEDSRESLRTAFYDGTEWLGSLEAQVMPRLDAYSAVLVDDRDDARSRWPIDAGQSRIDR